MPDSRLLKLALGPVQYYWPKDKIRAFYEEAKGMEADIIYLGETVCARRHEMREDDWLSLAEELKAAGKEVVLSTQVLLESGAHMQAMHRIAENTAFLAEANDMGAAGRMETGKRPFVAGPHLNVFNPPALRFMADLGACRWVAPIEMSGENIKKMIETKPDGIETEVFAYGRLPLAYSARCFTARYYNLQKDACGFRCIRHPDGLEVTTREQKSFLVFNGVQTQSANVYNLISELQDMKAMAVDILRISPQSEQTAGIVKIFRDVADGRLAAREGLEKIRPFMPGDPCSGYWHGRPGMDWCG